MRNRMYKPSEVTWILDGKSPIMSDEGSAYVFSLYSPELDTIQTIEFEAVAKLDEKAVGDYVTIYYEIISTISFQALWFNSEQDIPFNTELDVRKAHFLCLGGKYL